MLSFTHKLKPFAALVSVALIMIFITACSDQAGKKAAESLQQTIDRPAEKIKQATEQHQKQLESTVDASSKGASAPELQY